MCKRHFLQKKRSLQLEIFAAQRFSRAPPLSGSCTSQLHYATQTSAWGLNSSRTCTALLMWVGRDLCVACYNFFELQSPHFSEEAMAGLNFLSLPLLRTNTPYHCSSTLFQRYLLPLGSVLAQYLPAFLPWGHPHRRPFIVTSHMWR